jgi:hypothetical protein
MTLPEANAHCAESLGFLCGLRVPPSAFGRVGTYRLEGTSRREELLLADHDDDYNAATT